VQNIIKNLKKSSVKTIAKQGGKTKHLLITGDSSEVLKKISDESIDLIFTDPPYNMDIPYGKTYKDSLPWKKYYLQAENWFSEYNRVLKKTGSIYIMNYPEVNARILPFLEDKLGLKLQRWITWHYPTNIGHSNKNFTRSQRSILFLTKTDKYTFNRDKILQLYENPDVGKVRQLIKKGRKGRGAYDFLTKTDFIDMEMTNSKKDLFDSFYIDLLKNVSPDRLKTRTKNKVKSLHPCQLPFELIKRFIEVSTDPGDIVLDPFAGTFSTSAVANQLNRNSIGIEISPKYIRLGLSRLKN